MKTRTFNTAIHHQALALGFDAVGFAPATLPEEAKAGLQAFLHANHHGTMDWMARRAEQRSNPKLLWPEAQSVIIVGHNYAPDYNPLDKLKEKQNGLISAYALNKDYHEVMKKKLRTLAHWLAREYDCEVKLFVDTAPVMEKPLAAQTSIGWQGKHTCIVSKEFGSWLFLGEIFTTLNMSDAFNRHAGSRQTAGDAQSRLSIDDAFNRHAGSRQMAGDAQSRLLGAPQGQMAGEAMIQADVPVDDHCGSCTRCLDICPTNAFTAERKLDARKCLAYLTIEHKGTIPIEYRKALGNRVYGCDDCLAVCPWNKFAQTATESAYHARSALESPSLATLLQLDDAAFRTLFSKSPVKRTGFERFMRNVLIASGNSEDKTLVPYILPYTKKDNIILQESALWAIHALEH